MKILILGRNQSRRYNWGHQLFKNEIARQHEVKFYGMGHELWDESKSNINEIFNRLEFAPDLILSYMGKYCMWAEGMKEINIPKVHIVVDYFPWTWDEEDKFINENKIDLVFTPCSHEVRNLEKRVKTKIIKLPFSIDANIFNPNTSNRNKDVMAVFSVVSWAYPSRKKIINILFSMQRRKKISGVIQSSWPENRMWRNDYVNCMRGHKIVVNGVDKFGSLNWRFLEGCACGAMLLTEKAEDMDSMGFRDEVNCVVFNDKYDLEEQINKYLLNDELRERIAITGKNMVLNKHSCKQRVVEMTNIINKEFGL